MNLTSYLAQARHADRFMRACDRVAAEMRLPVFQDEIVFESDALRVEFSKRVAKLMNASEAKK